MVGRDFKFHNGKRGAALAIRLVEGGNQNKISRVLKDGTVVIEVAGKPDQPTRAMIKFLAEELDLDLTSLDIVEGKKGTDLLLSILDETPGEIQERIMSKIS